MIRTDKQKKRHAAHLAEKRARQKRALIAGRQPVKDGEYLDFIRKQPCFICGRRPSEAAHVGLRGMRQKSGDRETVPMCADHHRLTFYSHHVLGKRFWTHHGYVKEKVIQFYTDRFEEGTWKS